MTCLKFVHTIELRRASKSQVESQFPMAIQHISIDLVFVLRMKSEECNNWKQTATECSAPTNLRVLKLEAVSNDSLV